MRKYWWKILGVLLIIWSYGFGLLTPLKPGIPNVYPFNGNAGETVELTIEGYNTHFKEAKNNRVWLKLGDHSMLGTVIPPTTSNQLKVKFDLPKILPSTDTVVTFSLVTDNEIDGAAVLPSAIFITQDSIAPALALQNWQTAPIENLNQNKGITFPFRNVLGETIRNLYFHVSLWFAMFIMLTIAVFYSVRYLSKGSLDDDHLANSLISIAVTYGVLGCATGSIWAKFTWGTWWTADVKLNMSAIFMLIYLAYFVLRGAFQDEIKRARLTAVYNIFAFASIIPLLFVIPRLMDSLHPGNGGNPGFGGEDLDNTMRIAFYPAILGMTLLGLWIASLKYRFALLTDKVLDRN